MPSPIAALDIGTTKTCALIGEMTDAGAVRILGAGIAPRAECAKAWSRTSKKPRHDRERRRASGTRFRHADGIGLRGNRRCAIQSTNSRGVSAIHSGRGVTRDDIAHAMEAAEAIAVPQNREIIHAIPRGYTLDGQDGIKDPVGMIGFRLEVEAHVVTGAASSNPECSSKPYKARGSRSSISSWNRSWPGEAVLTPAEKEMGVVAR